MKIARITKGLYQDDLSKRMGISKSTVCGLETGRVNPRPDEIRKLCKILGVKPEELFPELTEKKKG